MLIPNHVILYKLQNISQFYPATFTVTTSLANFTIAIPSLGKHKQCFSIRRWYTWSLSVPVFVYLPKHACNGLVSKLSPLHTIIFGGSKTMHGIIVWKKGEPGEETIYAIIRRNFSLVKGKNKHFFFPNFKTMLV